ncbi:MAG: carbohydrate-binding protein [Paludibacter sp.]
MTFANNHKLENCVMQHDVIDAMIRQPQTTETKPYKSNTTASTIFTVDYDFGRAGYAYNDSLDANYHLNTNNYTAWNNAYNYRNDGVDIDVCNDATTNGYCVGWVENGDWTQYTIQSDEAMTYNILLRYASLSKTAKVYVEINGKRASKTFALAPSGSWSTWRTGAITNVIVPAGMVKVKLVFEQGGANINYFQFRNPKTIDNTVFEMLSAETDKWSDNIVVSVNKPIDTLNGNPFSITVDGMAASIISTAVNVTDRSKIDIKIATPILSTKVLKISYVTSDCFSGTQLLNTFQNADITNLTLSHKTIPGKIEAEDFTINNGFNFETCTDAGGGTNTSYAAVDKYLDYCVWVENSGTYNMDFRISVNSSSAQIAVLKDQNGSMIPIRTVSFTQTGGWQNWQTQSTTVSLTAGKNIIRLLSRTDGYNLNWIQFSQLTSIETTKASNIKIYPNPANMSFFLQFNNDKLRQIALLDMQGRFIKEYSTQLSTTKIDIRGIESGIYFVRINDSNEVITKKLQIN